MAIGAGVTAPKGERDMAEIVLGMALSHGPMLTTTPEQWPLRVPADRAGKHPFRGKVWRFDELAEHRRADRFDQQSTPEVMSARHAECHRALDRLAEIFAEARVDVAVIFGNDQMEIFSENLIPAFGVMWGERIVNAEMAPARKAHLPPGVAEAIPGYIPPGGATYRGSPELACHVIRTLMGDAFDPATLKAFPADETPHAFGFIYRRVMRDQPVPSVPLIQNTFFPPNQPSARRCYDFGRSVGKAIRTWKSDARVAVFASGGLSHFVIDEDLDRAFLGALSKRSAAEITGIREELLQSGNSEIKNWIALSGAMSDTDHQPSVVAYVPCYRSEAGTGTANGFVCWL
ncbi:MAG: protocatechuate 3,4-dioxygenase [Candidatus Acidiferrales bacterium]|jgi:3-O-methylgallate 3,4-dioxygenase